MASVRAPRPARVPRSETELRVVVTHLPDRARCVEAVRYLLERAAARRAAERAEVHGSDAEARP